MDIEDDDYFWILGVPAKIWTGNLKNKSETQPLSQFARLSQITDDFNIAQLVVLL